MKRIIIIGGGAAGLAAALAAAREAPDARVTVLERLDRVGKKILATGNGRCNLTNANAGPAHYHSARRDALERALRGMEAEDALRFFESLGLLCQQEDEGRIYPYCRQASMVLDVLLRGLERRHIDVQCGCAVTDLSRKNSCWTALCADGRRWQADAVILAAGGKAASKLGSDGSGFELASRLGHRCTPLYPALVALRCDMTGLGGLKGIRAAAGLTLTAGDRALGQDCGEIQFTEYGLSGIPAMQLSGILSQLKKGERCTALVDLFPKLSQKEVRQLLRDRRDADPQGALETLLLGTIHKRLAYAVLKSAGLQPLSRKNRTLESEDLACLAQMLKSWPFPVKETMGWEQAQVTGGGVSLEEIDPDTMASKCQPGLYLAGEVLDVVGDCGGFNLHWAWCSGIRAGKAAAREVLQ